MRVGFVIDGLYPSLPRVLKGHSRIHHILFGQSSNTSIALMRFKWIASHVNCSNNDVRFELYRPWRRYELVVLMKSMGTEIEQLALDLSSKGTTLVYDANVDYLTPSFGTFYYKGMRPTEKQRDECSKILALVDGVIADSEHINGAFREKCDSSSWISDNVNMELVPAYVESPLLVRGKLSLLWSGVSCKLFDLLLIENVLRSYRKFIHLHIITDRLSGMDRLFEPWQGRLKRLLNDLDVTVEQFVSIPHLLERYSKGGVAISPRFLDNSYNLGHTEWKITLPMACGRTVLCSPQLSYKTVALRNMEKGVKICESENDWKAYIESLLTGELDLGDEERSCIKTVEKHYSTPIVAEQQTQYFKTLLSLVNH